VTIEEVSKIVDALDELLRARWEHERIDRPPREGEPKFKLYNFIEEKAEHGVSRWGFDDLVDDPIRYGLNRAIRKAGELLYRLTGSTDAMLKVLEEVAGRDKANETYRSYILDKHWDGIGEGYDQWIA
jgi:hypothetical protein